MAYAEIPVKITNSGTVTFFGEGTTADPLRAVVSGAPEFDNVTFDPETGDLTITTSANYRVTNLDGRYRRSVEVVDVIDAIPTTVYAFSTIDTKGAFIDYVLQEETNTRVGRLVAVWDGTNAFHTNYSSPEIGTLPVDIFLETSGPFVFLRTNSEVNNVYFKALITTI